MKCSVPLIRKLVSDQTCILKGLFHLTELTKFDIPRFAYRSGLSHIRIIYDWDTLLILGGCPPGGVPYVHVFLLGGAKRLLYWGTIMVTVECNAKKPL